MDYMIGWRLISFTLPYLRPVVLQIRGRNIETVVVDNLAQKFKRHYQFRTITTLGCCPWKMLNKVVREANRGKSYSSYVNITASCYRLSSLKFFPCFVDLRYELKSAKGKLLFFLDYHHFWFTCELSFISIVLLCLLCLTVPFFFSNTRDLAMDYHKS